MRFAYTRVVILNRVDTSDYAWNHTCRYIHYIGEEWLSTQSQSTFMRTGIKRERDRRDNNSSFKFNIKYILLMKTVIIP